MTTKEQAGIGYGSIWAVEVVKKYSDVMPGSVVLILSTTAVMAYIFKDTGWDAPFR